MKVLQTDSLISHHIKTTNERAGTTPRTHSALPPAPSLSALCDVTKGNETFPRARGHTCSSQVFGSRALTSSSVNGTVLVNSWSSSAKIWDEMCVGFKNNGPFLTAHSTSQFFDTELHKIIIIKSNCDGTFEELTGSPRCPDVAVSVHVDSQGEGYSSKKTPQLLISLVLMLWLTGKRDNNIDFYIFLLSQCKENYSALSGSTHMQICVGPVWLPLQDNI